MRITTEQVVEILRKDDGKRRLTGIMFSYAIFHDGEYETTIYTDTQREDLSGPTGFCALGKLGYYLNVNPVLLLEPEPSRVFDELTNWNDTNHHTSFNELASRFEKEFPDQAWEIYENQD